jgi:hypothetical protein
LQLLAQDTVQVRDSVSTPFLAQAGGNLYIQGKERIDILALNHPQTPFQSGSELSLVSNGDISGDAHFTSGSSFSILDLSAILVALSASTTRLSVPMAMSFLATIQVQRLRLRR